MLLRNTTATQASFVKPKLKTCTVMTSHKSVYHQAFTELYSRLVRSLKSEYTDLTDRLFSEFLISEIIRDTVRSRTTGQTETERTRILLDGVQSKISENPSGKNYQKFLEVLTENAVYEDIAKLLREKVQELTRKQSKSINSTAITLR